MKLVDVLLLNWSEGLEGSVRVKCVGKCAPFSSQSRIDQILLMIQIFYLFSASVEHVRLIFVECHLLLIKVIGLPHLVNRLNDRDLSRLKIIIQRPLGIPQQRGLSLLHGLIKGLGLKGIFDALLGAHIFGKFRAEASDHLC